jgi:hypothetical protein
MCPGPDVLEIACWTTLETANLLDQRMIDLSPSSRPSFHVYIKRVDLKLLKIRLISSDLFHESLKYLNTIAMSPLAIAFSPAA